MDWIDRLRTHSCTTAAVACVAALVVLPGCSVMGPRGSPLPQDGPDMVSLYRGHMEQEGSDGQAIRERLPVRTADDDQLSTQRRSDLSPLQQRFQRLPNPDLVMTVFPHLAKGKYPIPGYVTVFPMYESVEYAMPGEVSGRSARNDEVLAQPKPSEPTATRNGQASVPRGYRPAPSRLIESTKQCGGSTC